MVNLNDVLLAMSNIPVDDPIAEIWGRQLQGGYKIIEYTGTLPIAINANGEALIDYRIYGADGGVGEPTENLFDLAKSEMNCYYDISGTKRNSNSHNTSDYIPVESGKTYMLSLTRVNNGFGVYLNLWDDGKQFVTNLLSLVNPDGSYSFSSPINGYIRFNWVPNYTHNIMLTKGSTAPTSYIPYGYKLPMMTRGENLFDPNAKSVDNGYINNSAIGYPDGEIYNIGWAYVTEYIPVDGNTNYIIFTNLYRGSVDYVIGLAFYDENKNFISAIKGYIALTEVTYENPKGGMKSFTTPENCKYIRTNVDKIATMLMLVAASTPPPTYIPYSPRTDTPVYIGENQLEENEYVSFSEQKIYRDVSGTLTPTDPPVPLPEIPTIKGETVIDYDGTPKPSQMYVKYKGKE